MLMAGILNNERSSQPGIYKLEINQSMIEFLASLYPIWLSFGLFRFCKPSLWLHNIGAVPKISGRDEPTSNPRAPTIRTKVSGYTRPKRDTEHITTNTVINLALHKPFDKIALTGLSQSCWT